MVADENVTSGNSARDAAIARLLDDTVHRRAAGEKLSDETVILDHGDLMPALAERLKLLHKLDRAEVRSQEPASPSEPPPETSTETQTLQDKVAVAGIPKRIGQYHIKRAIASGGMGTVYEAVQEKPRRTVALKLMRAGIASRSALRRFEYESQLLARLRHPGIAQVYDAGTHRDGEVTVPYFAMEYIVGAKPVTDYVKEKKLGIRDRMMLFANVCEAVHHGHQKGIIHRDLKPSNIMVDSSGQVKIIDFGVARSTDSDMAVTTLQTNVGQLIGTLQYMSPEQCAADPHDIDTRSDVYALGVVFYEMLCKRLPYKIRGTAIHEATRVIREQEPAKLSTLNNTLRGDVETISLKALEKDRERRYQSAADLAQDIRRYLNNEAISARPPSLTYHLRIFARRHKAGCSAVAALFVLLVVGVIVSTSLYLRAERAREQAEARQEEAEMVTGFLYDIFESVDPAKAQGREVTTEEMLNQAAGRITNAFPRMPLTEANLQLVIGNAYRGLGKYPDAEPHLRAALRLRRNRLGREHLEVAEAMTDLGSLADSRGDQDQAAKLWREALEIRRKLLGEEHELVAESLTNLGVLFWRRGDYASAEPLWRKALKSRREALGSEHPSVAGSLNRLAALLQQKGDYAEAELMYTQSLDIRRRVYGDVHPDVAESLNNLVALLTESRQYKRAKPLLAEALQIYRKLHGREHADIARSLANMAEVVAKDGDPATAEPLARQAVEMQRKLVGVDHIETGMMLVTLGEILLATGKGSQAESPLRDALQNLRKVLPQGHFVRLVGESLLGASLSLQRKQAEAEPLLVASFEALSGGRGTSDKYTLDALRRVVQHFERIGESDKAARYRALRPAGSSPQIKP